MNTSKLIKKQRELLKFIEQQTSLSLFSLVVPYFTTTDCIIIDLEEGNRFILVNTF